MSTLTEYIEWLLEHCQFVIDFELFADNMPFHELASSISELREKEEAGLPC